MKRMPPKKPGHKNKVLGSTMRRSMVLELLKDGPVTTAQVCGILGWPNDTAWPIMHQLYKLGRVRRESRKVHSTREFVYTLRVDPETYWSTVLTKDSYAY